jgi:hypothetical protein
MTTKEWLLAKITRMMITITYMALLPYFASLFYNYYSAKGYEEIEKNGVYSAGRITKLFNKRNSHIGLWFLTPKGKFFTGAVHPHKGYLQGCHSYEHICKGRAIVVRYLPNDPSMYFIDMTQDTLPYIHILDTVQ